MNKVYQFVGAADEPATQLITNMNFYASDMCIGIASSFITQWEWRNHLMDSASLKSDESNHHCDEGNRILSFKRLGFEPFVVSYDALHFVVHNSTYLSLFNVTCNIPYEEERLYDVL